MPDCALTIISPILYASVVTLVRRNKSRGVNE